jgi:O-antigen ligase
MKRQHLILVVTLAALFGSLVTVFATLQEYDFELRGYVDASQNANLPFRVPRLGVNVELTQYNPQALQQQLERMDAAHITWVRQIFAWDRIEPEVGQFQWEAWDAIVEAVAQSPNLRLVAVLMNTPTWARKPQSQELRTSPPADPAQFASFARAVAERYGDTIDYYQVWDEPNLTETWGGLEPRAADYAALLRESYSAIHGTDTEAILIAGALAPTTETGPQNISDILYLRDLYALGAKPFMDALGAKPYGFSVSPEDRTIDPNILNFSHIVALREEMVRNEDGNKAIWAMNWGWNSLPSTWEGRASIWGSVSADEQVNYTLSALTRVEREWPWLAGMILQLWQPDTDPNDPIWGFSIIDQENQPTQLYNALINRPQALAAENGLFPATNLFAHYSGVWSFGDMGADIGWVGDSQFTFQFTGKSVSLLLRQDDYVAYLYPTIDGEPANATPHDNSGNGYIVLTSGSLTPEMNLVPVGRDLPDGQHILHAVADRGWDRWAIAGYGVSSGDLAAPFSRQLLVAWISVAVSVVSVFVAARQTNWSITLTSLSGIVQQLNQATQLIISAITSIALLIGMVLTFGDGTPNILRREAIQLGTAIITAGVIYTEPGFILTVISAFVLLVLIYNKLDIGLTLVIFWTPFFLFPVELYQFAFPLSEILVLITGLAWLIKSLATKGRERQTSVSQFASQAGSRFSKRLSLIDYGVIAWVILGFLSLGWAEYRGQALTELRVMILEPALFYLILRTTPLNQKIVLRLVDALILAGFVVAVVGLWQFVRGDAIITAEAGAQRLASVYGSPNNVGLFLGRCIPFALALLISPIDNPRRLLAAIMLTTMGAAVVLSQSVGALFIGIPVSVVTVLLLAMGRRARYILLGFSVIAVIAFLISIQSERFARVLTFDSGTNFYRIRVWESAINVIRDHPVTGLGLDQFLYAFRGHYILPDAWQEPNLSHPHNEILDAWVRLGILGVFVFIFLEVGFWKYATRAFRLNRAHPLVAALAIGMIGSMANLISHGLVDNSIYVQDLCYVYILLLALASQLSNIRAIDEPHV